MADNIDKSIYKELGDYIQFRLFYFFLLKEHVVFHLFAWLSISFVKNIFLEESVDFHTILRKFEKYLKYFGLLGFPITNLYVILNDEK